MCLDFGKNIAATDECGGRGVPGNVESKGNKHFEGSCKLLSKKI